jgi:predicted TIM-barrel fold metal-dependent hydrolase
MTYIPDYIIDAHQHLWGLQKSEYYQLNTLDSLLEINEKNKISESWISCVPLDGREFSNENTNSPVEHAFKRYPKKFRGMGFVVLGVDGAAKVRELKARGFFGLKIIFPFCSYDDVRNDPIWEAAIECKMPVTFHTGPVTNIPFRNMNPCDMFPGRLYRIKAVFPELIMLIAHMGDNYFKDAASLATGENNYLDCSGGGALKAMPKSFFDNTICWKEVRHKLVFGVDQLFYLTAHSIKLTSDFAEKVEFSEEEHRLMWNANAEKIISQAS